MTDAETGSRITLDWPHDTAYQAVGRLVLGGVAARTDLPIDRVEELGLALDTISRGRVAGDRLDLDISVDPESISASMGTLVDDPLGDPGVRRIIDALVDRAESEHGTAGHRVSVTLATAPTA